ncbi:MAG: hypothetical protein ACI8TX_003202, partial [Hyphomicrobiaceae bacterium]
PRLRPNLLYTLGFSAISGTRPHPRHTHRELARDLLDGSVKIGVFAFELASELFPLFRRIALCRLTNFTPPRTSSPCQSATP